MNSCLRNLNAEVNYAFYNIKKLLHTKKLSSSGILYHVMEGSNHLEFESSHIRPWTVRAASCMIVSDTESQGCGTNS